MTLRTDRPRRDNPPRKRIDCHRKPVRFSSEYLSPYFVTKAEKMIGELKNPYILIHGKNCRASR